MEIDFEKRLTAFEGWSFFARDEKILHEKKDNYFTTTVRRLRIQGNGYEFVIFI